MRSERGHRPWNLRAISLLIASSAVAVAGGCRRPGDEFVKQGEVAASPLPALAAETLRRIEAVERRAEIASLMARLGVPGASVAVVRGGELDWARGYGVAAAGEAQPVTPETLFQAASVSKPVAAAAALRLAEEGKLALDGEVNDALDGWTLRHCGSGEPQAVTLRQLLSHTAGVTVHGFTGYAAGERVPSLAAVLEGSAPANSEPICVDLEPGTAFRYSGGGYCVVQRLIEAATGEPFPAAMRGLVLEPLAMTSSTFEQPLPASLAGRAASGHRSGRRPVPGRWHTYPEMAAAGLWTTPTDLARFVLGLRAAAAGAGRALLRRETVEAMWAAQADGMGLGWFLEGEGADLRILHGGSNEGFRCLLVAYPYRGDGAVVMTNSDTGGPLAEAILVAIAHVYGW